MCQRSILHWREITQKLRVTFILRMGSFPNKATLHLVLAGYLDFKMSLLSRHLFVENKSTTFFKTSKSKSKFENKHNEHIIVLLTPYLTLSNNYLYQLRSDFKNFQIRFQIGK